MDFKFLVVLAVAAAGALAALFTGGMVATLTEAGLAAAAEQALVIVSALMVMVVARPADKWAANSEDEIMDRFKRGPDGPGRWAELAELAELLPNGEVDRFEHPERLGMDLERVGAIHFEPEEGRKAETDLIRDRDGYITVGGTSEHGRPAGREVAAAWMFRALKEMQQRQGGG